VGTLMLWLQLMGGDRGALRHKLERLPGPAAAQLLQRAGGVAAGRPLPRLLAPQGLWLGGQNLRPPLDALREAKASGIRRCSISASSATGPCRRARISDANAAGERQWLHSLSDPALPGEFLHDFIIYSRPPEGRHRNHGQHGGMADVQRGERRLRRASGTIAARHLFCHRRKNAGAGASGL
jgi:hypothetical protein